jgi:ribosome-associated protein YbcJ (S4-like RNA binding protein)
VVFIISRLIYRNRAIATRRSKKIIKNIICSL